MRLLFVLALLPACGKRDECEPLDESGCADGEVCEEVEGGEPACFAPLAIEGRVFDLGTEDPVEGARVVAMDANGAPRSAVGVTDAEGGYRIAVPSRRDEDGNPVGDTVTLRADAAGYQPFPSGVRVALPVDTSEAEETDDGYALANGATDVGLVEMPEGTGTGAIAGVCEVPAEGAGVLVVAGGATGVADRDGAYAIFNLDPGSHTVTAYATGVNYAPATVEVEADATAQADLSIADTETATLSGTVQIVNAPGGSVTSVILVEASTFDDVLARGEMPPGLRAAGVSGSFSIAGVPRGDWVVLAAFENDGLVRDPDPSIGGTQIQYVTVSDDAPVAVEGFKVTEALRILSPGADGEEQVGDAPTLSWVDDSSEDAYQVSVYDAFGRLVWETPTDRATGSDPAIGYAGPALEPGMYYQLRVTSFKAGAPITQSEDLKGVFYR